MSLSSRNLQIRLALGQLAELLGMGAQVVMVATPDGAVDLTDVLPQHGDSRLILVQASDFTGTHRSRPRLSTVPAALDALAVYLDDALDHGMFDRLGIALLPTDPNHAVYTA